MYWRIFIFVAFIALAGFPLNVGADQISPNPNFGTIELHNSSALDLGIFSSAFNLGIYANYGTVRNYETFWSAFAFNNQGQLSNFGKLTNYLYLNNYGGTMINYGNLGGGPYARYIQNGGATINNGNWAQPSSVINSGSLSGTGTFTGTVTSGTGATVHPGDPQGMLTINGTFSSQGTLLIDIGGPEAEKYGRLDVNGLASFDGGTVEFNFIDGYKPQKGHWDFLFFDTVDGWKTLGFTLEGLGSGYAWDVKLLSDPDRATLFITEAPPAPLPGTLLLFGSGFVILSLYCRNKLTAKN